MKRTWVFVVPLFLSFLLTGCPFESKMPIGDPQAALFDARLLGHWTWTEPKDGGVTRFSVFRFNNSEYYVEIQEGEKKVERNRMYIVSLGGQQFMCINSLREDDAASSFSFARYSVSDTGALSIRFVGDQAVPKSLAFDRQGLIDFLAAHLNGTVLDDPDGQFLLYRPK